MLELALGLRRLRRRPLRGLAAALTLAIGVGALTAAGDAVWCVLLRDLPVERQDELVVVRHVDPDRGSLPIPFRAEDYGVVASELKSLSAVAGFSAWGALPVLAEAADGSYPLRRVVIAGDFFGVLGTGAALGRVPGAEDDEVGAHPVAVLSHRAWRSRFGGDPAIIGTTLRLAGVTSTVVGVAQEGFDFPRGTEVWVPLRLDYANQPEDAPRWELHLVGRMRPGVDAATVASDVETTEEAVGDDRSFLAGLQPVVQGFEEHVLGSMRPVLLAMLGAALLLLFAAVANATLLLLAGGSVAAHEVAVRRVLGAERLRIVGRVLVDAWLLGVIGTVGGAALAWLALGTLLPLAPSALPKLDDVGFGAGPVLIAIVVGTIATVAMGGAAGVMLSRLDLRGVLSEAGRGQAGTGSSFRRSVAALQVGLTVISAVGAGLLARTVVAMDRLDPGFFSEDMTVVSLRVPYTWFQVPESYLLALEDVVSDLEGRPGIVSARPTLSSPLQQRLEIVLRAEGQDDEAARENPYVAMDAVLPGHFEALGIPLLAGRDLGRLDNRPDAPPVVVVDEVLARALWPGEDPVGKRIDGLGHPGEWFTVVGVVAGTRYRDFLELHPRAYYPLRKLGNSPPAALLVRTTPAAPASLRAIVDEAFARVDPGVRVLREERMEDALRSPTVSRRFAAGVLLAFAGVTLLLAVVGVYGVFSVAVQERTREMGVRRALGADRGGLVVLVLGGILRVALVGGAAGLLPAWWAGRLLGSLLYGIRPGDPATFAAVLVGSLTMALLAGVGPALRASRVDPAVSLRSE